MAILEGKDLSVSYYGDISVLRNVSIRVEEGMITAIIGPNGAGKSTLLKTLYGLLKPRTGAVFLDNQDITRLKTHQFLRRGISYVPQLRSIFPDLTVQENLELGTWVFKRDAARVRAAIQSVYDRFPALAEKRSTAAGLLSGGQQKILEIARSLLTKPRICLLDEPTATLAPRIAGQIYDTLLHLKVEAMTVAMVDQRVKQAFDISDRLYVLDLGEMRAHGPKRAFEGELHDMIKSWLD